MYNNCDVWSYGAVFCSLLLVLIHLHVVVAVQSLTHVQFFVTPWTAAHQASLSFTISQTLLKLMSIESVMPSNHLIFCLLFASGGQSIGVSASASVLPMNIQDWFPLGLTGWISLQSKGTLKSLPQHHSSKASILWCSAFFMVQFSHPYMTTGKTTVLTRRTFVGKVMSLLFNTLSRFVIVFLPRNKRHACSHHLQWFWRPRK